MEFIADNYIWIIIVGIIILMTIIGYIADKTDFGKKTMIKKEKTKKVKEVEPQEQIEEDLEEIPVELPQDDLNPIETFPADFEEKIEPAFDTDEMDLSPQIEEFKEETDTNEEIPEELFAGIDGTPNVYKQEDVELPKEDKNEESEEIVENNNESNEEIENLEIELPSIESLNQELADETEDDDVWKF